MEYWVVANDNINEVANRIKQERDYVGDTLESYLRREFENADKLNQVFVVFKRNGEWVQTMFGKEYNVDFVMSHHPHALRSEALKS